MYSLNFHPERIGIGKYSGELAEWLHQQGHEVRVITSPPYYPNWRVFEGFSACAFAVEHHRHSDEVAHVGAGTGSPDEQPPVKVFRCPLWVPRKPSGVKRILHLLSFSLSSSLALARNLAWRPDVIWVVEPTLFCSPFALAYSMLTGAKSWLHIQDFEVDAAFELDFLRKLPLAGTMRRCASYLERLLMRMFHRISTISTRMAERVQSKSSRAAFLFPNWVDANVIHPSTSANGFRAALGLGRDVCVALYSGNMGTKQGLEILADAVALSNQDGVARNRLHFVFCGDGPLRGSFERSCCSYPNVTFLDLQPTERLNELLNLADIHLLPQQRSAADLVMPSKLSGMLASGRPVVTTAAAGTQLACLVSRCGIVVEPEDARALLGALLRLSVNSGERRKLGEIARRFAVELWGKETVLRSFEREMQKLAAKRDALSING